MSAWYDILDAEVPTEDQTMVSLAANRYLNMVPGQRPSDAMRSEVAAYKRFGAVEYRRRFEAERS